MPTLDETSTSHRLPRTEAVDLSSRMNHLLELGSIESAVDDMLIPPTPLSSASFACTPGSSRRQTGAKQVQENSARVW